MVVRVKQPLGLYWAGGCTGSLSFHCQEREVVAALWGQPGAVPSTLKGHETWAFAQATWPTTWLGTGEPAEQFQTQPYELNRLVHTSLELQAHATELGDGFDQR